MVLSQVTVWPGKFFRPIHEGPFLYWPPTAWALGGPLQKVLVHPGFPPGDEIQNVVEGEVSVSGIAGFTSED
jgi:hypothetical protein